jgi:Peptide methionine sulfoxide reductase
MTDGELLAKATFSGGCFWCLQPPFDTLDGVVVTVVGYTGRRKTNPSHEDVTAGRTGHALAVQGLYDPRQLPYVNYWMSSGTTSILPYLTGNSVSKGRSIAPRSSTTTRPKST